MKITLFLCIDANSPASGGRFTLFCLVSRSPALPLWYVNLTLFTSTNIKFLFNILRTYNTIEGHNIRKLERINTPPLQNKDQTSNRLF